MLRRELRRLLLAVQWRSLAKVLCWVLRRVLCRLLAVRWRSLAKVLYRVQAAVQQCSGVQGAVEGAVHAANSVFVTSGQGAAG